jgi:hypothetical protein
MGELLLNGRRPTDWELPDSVIRRGGSAVARAAQESPPQALELLAGVLAEEPPPERVPRPLADVVTGML